MERLEKIVTRFYHPIVLEAWYKGMTDGFRKTIGGPFSDMIVKFDGRKMEIFRIEDELNGVIKEEILRYVKKRKFLKHVDAYKKEVDDYYRALIDGKDIDKVIKYFVKIYPILAISYFVSNLWRSDLNFYDKKSDVLIACQKYRKLSDGIFNRLVTFVDRYLEQKNLSLFSTLKDLDNKTEPKVWMDEKFIYSHGVFSSLFWDDFLDRSEYEYEEEKIGISQKARKITGDVAHKGKAQGKVRIIFSALELDKVKRGEILVAPMIQPSFLSVLGKVKAIVTDEGGVTCHAVIMAREIGKPSVVGTKIATKFLKDGDEIEVDGDKGAVKIVKRKKIIKEKVKKEDKGFLTELKDVENLPQKNKIKITEREEMSIVEMEEDEAHVKIEIGKTLEDEGVHLKIASIEDEPDFDLNPEAEKGKEPVHIEIGKESLVSLNEKREGKDNDKKVEINIEEEGLEVENEEKEPVLELSPLEGDKKEESEKIKIDIDKIIKDGFNVEVEEGGDIAPKLETENEEVDEIEIKEKDVLSETGDEKKIKIEIDNVKEDSFNLEVEGRDNFATRLEVKEEQEEEKKVDKVKEEEDALAEMSNDKKIKIDIEEQEENIEEVEVKKEEIESPKVEIVNKKEKEEDDFSEVSAKDSDVVDIKRKKSGYEEIVSNSNSFASKLEGIMGVSKEDEEEDDKNNKPE